MKLGSGSEKDERIIEKLVRQQVDIYEMELGLYQSLNVEQSLNKCHFNLEPDIGEILTNKKKNYTSHW